MTRRLAGRGRHAAEKIAALASERSGMIDASVDVGHGKSTDGYAQLPGGPISSPQAAAHKGHHTVRQFWMNTTATCGEIDCIHQQFRVELRMKLHWIDPTFKDVELARSGAGGVASGLARKCIQDDGFRDDGSINVGWDFDCDPGQEHLPINMDAVFKNTLGVPGDGDNSRKVDWMSYHSGVHLVSIQLHMKFT
jgi:hypothetical protein